MNNRHSLWRAFRTIGLALTLGMSMSACAMGGASWKEEVLLHDGQKIVVGRSIERGGRHEIGQQPPVKEESLSFTVPGTNDRVLWKSEYSEDIGYADFGPLLVDVLRKTAYVVAAPIGCLSYNKWGRPNPPYIVFKYQNNTWNRIALQELPTEIKTPNLIFSSPDNEVEKLGKSFVSAAMVRHANSDLTQPEYKTILREAYPAAAGSCGEMIYDGNGGWIGTGWFRDQPTYEACLKYCDRQKISAQYCPCETLFKGKK